MVSGRLPATPSWRTINSQFFGEKCFEPSECPKPEGRINREVTEHPFIAQFDSSRTPLEQFEKDPVIKEQFNQMRERRAMPRHDMDHSSVLYDALFSKFRKFGDVLPISDHPQRDKPIFLTSDLPYPIYGMVRLDRGSENDPNNFVDRLMNEFAVRSRAWSEDGVESMQLWHEDDGFEKVMLESYKIISPRDLSVDQRVDMAPQWKRCLLYTSPSPRD